MRKRILAGSLCGYCMATPALAQDALPAPNSGGDARPQTYGGPITEDKEWTFDYSGFLRAPMRVGMNERTTVAEGQSATTFHRPIIPDDQYLSWQYSGRGNDWAELFFSVGNKYVAGTVALQAFQFTDAAWAEPTAQLGITLGYLTITPDMPWKNVRTEFVVGSHWNRYGQAGKYDSGKYDTFVHGRTHVIGYTAKAELDVPNTELTLTAEQGFGTKRPNPSIFNGARFTLLHHLHGGGRYADWLDFGLHYLDSWTTEEVRDAATLASDDAQPTGRMRVIGPEARFEMGPGGDLYLGYSRIHAFDAITVAPAIEVLHSFGGGEFSTGVTANYLNGGGPIAGNGNGTVDTLAGQYEFHVNRAMPDLAPRDLTVFLFGMANFVTSDDPDLDLGTVAPGETRESSITKLKYGVDVVGDILPWLGAAVRFDRFQPNSEIPEQSFSTLYPRVLFRTDFVTHELISLGYTRYFYNQRGCDQGSQIYQCVQPPPAPVFPSGFGASSGSSQEDTFRGQPGFATDSGFAPQLPDQHVFTLEASMWW